MAKALGVLRSAVTSDISRCDVDYRMWVGPHEFPIVDDAPSLELADNDPLSVARGVLFGLLLCAPFWATIAAYIVLC